MPGHFRIRRDPEDRGLVRLLGRRDRALPGQDREARGAQIEHHRQYGGCGNCCPARRQSRSRHDIGAAGACGCVFAKVEARVAFPVNPGNPVRSVSLVKLKQILSGQIDNWRTIGGPDLAIHVVALRDGGGTRRTAEARLLDGQSMTPHSANFVESAEEVVQAVAHDRGALGISEASLVNLRRLPELQTKVLIAQSYNLVSLNDPTDAMRAVIAATRSVVFDEEP